MRILLLSAYDAASHCRWRQGLVAAFPSFDWTVLTLPPRYFNWRVRGNSLTWAYQERETLEAGYDVLVATSMVDLSALKGMVPALSLLPAIVYFHENQFDYPVSGEQFKTIEPQVLSIYTALAADRLVFNSTYNYQTFVTGVGALLRKMPDYVPSGIIDLIETKSEVLPVPLEEQCFCRSPYDEFSPPMKWSPRGVSSVESRPLRLLWAARFEYDKGGDRLLLILRALQRLNVDFELVLLGQAFRSSPAVFAEIKQEFSRQLVQFGFEEDQRRFQQYLQRADIVLSTAIHEFQGLAVMEAVAAGCIPVLPDRLAYRDFYPTTTRYPSMLEDPGRESELAAEHIAKIWCCIQKGVGVGVTDVNPYRWSTLREAYYRLLVSAVSQQGR